MGDLYRQFIDRTDLTIHKWHHYFPIYERHLAKYRNGDVHLLEIGVQNGGSARLLADWLGPNSKITGIDIDENCRSFAIPGRIDIEIGDQADKAFLESVAHRFGPWDVVIDDGGHTANQIFTSFDVLFPHLRDGGTYLIEDTHAHFWGGSFLDHPQKKTILDFVATRFFDLHRWTADGRLFQHWHVPPPQRQPRPLPYVAAHTDGVHFYDSVVVVDKALRREPFVEMRVANQPRTTSFRFEDYEKDV